MYNRQKPFKSMWRKTLSLLLAVVLVATLLPIQPSYAADDFNFNDYSTDPTAPTQVNSKTIQVRGTYTGVSSNTIQFKVEQLRGEGANQKVAAVTNGTGISPTLEGNNVFTFLNVGIYEGLNRITISGSASGQVVSKSAYVYFPNVPTIYDIRTIDNRVATADYPTVITAPTVTLMFKAPNTSSVMVNGKLALYGGGDTYLVADQPLVEGMNTLVFTASNETMTYSVTREFVRYIGAPTGSNIAVGSGAAKVSLEGNPTVGPNNVGATSLTGKVSGYLFVEKQAGAAAPTLQVDVQDIPETTTTPTITIGPLTTQVSFVRDISVADAVYSYSMYQFTTDNDLTITGKSAYSLRVTGTYGTDSVSYPITFKYQPANSPLIEEVRQVYNVALAGTTGVYNYSSSSAFVDNLTFFQAPIWIAVKAKNFTPGTDSATLTTTQGGVVIGSPAFTYSDSSGNVANSLISSNGELLFKITNMPEGEQTLNLKINKGAESDTKNIPITFIPTPFIEFTELYNGQVFEGASTFTEVKAKLYNFNLTSGSADRDSIRVTINGTISNIASTAIQADGTFTLPTTADALKLVDGPNMISISGTSSGVPVSTSITVYLFITDRPIVQSIIPLPVAQTTDTEKKFTSSGNLQYSTSEKRMDVRFTVSNTTAIQVSIDGQLTNTGTYNSISNTWNLTQDTPQSPLLSLTATSSSEYTFTLNNTLLPDTGTKSITVSAMKSTSTSSQTMQVNRVRVPYTVLSPKLPNEAVINQNFLNVSIQAEGAEQIMLGKEAMVKGTDDIFRLELKNLKTGKNTVQFTISTDGNDTKHQFDVTYAAKNEVGAQLKTTIPTSGKLTSFNGDMVIAFPKNTLLKKPENKLITSNIPPIDLFNSQQLLLGIADPVDGRTVKQYNRVGEYQGTAPLDGQLGPVSPNGYATNILQGSRSHFGFASQLFWIDGGYFVPTTAGTTTSYKTVDGQHPYVANDTFFTRSLEKWLEPTERGTITLKYNENIRNESAANLSVWRFYNNAWQNLGGVVSTSKKTVTASFDGFGYYAVFSVRYGYEDITGHRYARNYLDTMFAKGIMQPLPNGALFGVYDNITRGEFATMIVRMLDLPLNYDTIMGANTFTDVPTYNVPGSLWDYRHIETAARAGIISGMGPRTYNPGGYLTREQAAVIISRAMNIKTGDVTKDAAALAKAFIDAGSVDYYAVSYVQAITKAKIMSGSPNPLEEGQKKETYSFNPKANLNRADMAIIAYNVMKQLKKF